MRRPFLIVLTATGLLLSVSGCALLKNLFSDVFEKPTFRFKTAKVREASLSGMTVDLVYQLDNPNSVGLTLADVDYRFFVEGKQLVAGKPREGLSLKPNGETELTFPAEVKFRDLAPVIQTFLKQDTAAYRAEGNVGVKTPLGVVHFPLSKEGRVALPKVPAISIGSPRIENLGLTSATLQIPISLKNRSSLPLPIGGLSGQLSIAGARVGTVSSGDVGLLTAGETKSLTLPLQVNFSHALSAASALRSGRGQVELDGKLTSGLESVKFEVKDLVTFLK